MMNKSNFLMILMGLFQFFHSIEAGFNSLKKSGLFHLALAKI